ncbi:MAG: diguanylate phosphodiesterase [Thermoanaerobacteraceae bacterium]|nr:diguanylate phosphodiesterase [Thermoanaerobacteraceae bacterium]
MKKSGISKLLILFILTAIIINITGCGSKPEQNTVGSLHMEEAFPLVIRLEGGDWGLPSPFAHYSRGPGMSKMRLIYDSLLEKGEEGLIPWLAKDWSISPDGKEYTFVLNSQVKWHDGKMLTAEDVKFSFEYFLKHPPVSNSLLIDGKPFIEKIEIVDEDQVKIVVSEPNATVLDRLGIVRIIPKHIWEFIDDPKKVMDLDKLIGCGPYILTDYSQEQGAYRFQAFKEYWGPEPLVDTIEFVPVSDPVLAFENGEIDLIKVPQDLMDRYMDNKEYKFLKSPAFWGYKLMFNMEKKPELSDVNVRKAIAHAIDIDELIEKVARGAAVPASPGYLSVDHIWYNPDVTKYEFDIEKAKELLNNRTLELTLLIADDQKEARIAELLKINLAKAGINLTVQTADMKTRDSRVKEQNYELALIGHGGWGQDADILRENYGATLAKDSSPSSNVIPGYSNPQINGLCKKQLTELDEQSRKSMIMELQKLISDEIPLFPLYNTVEYAVFKPEKYDGWLHVFDHHEITHNKLSYLER